jgi:hypothetical protein
MTLRQSIQAAPGKTEELIAKLSATSNQAVKTRESLFAQLGDELNRYVEFEEQHFLPLLRKHPETKGLAGDALKGNKDLRASLAKLSDMPKDNDEFIAELDGMNKSFQRHVRNERKELLPAILKALSDEEAGALAADIEGAVADADKAKRDEKRDDAAQTRRQAAEAEEAAVAQRAASRAEKAAERTSREATEKVVDSMARGASSMQDNARQATTSLNEQTQKIALEAREAVAAYGDASTKIRDDMVAVRASSNISIGAASEVYSAWMEWFGNAARSNSEGLRQLLQCKTMKQVADVQNELATRGLRNWMESSVKMLQITQLASKQAMGPLDGRLTAAV